nr:hypothetical protein [Tanacetum cinerariifolium]
MLVIGRYPQWRSRFLRYIDTRPYGDALKKCILMGPYKPTTVLIQAVAAIDDSLAIPKYTTIETPMNMSPKNKAHFEAEKEAIHLILTGIGDEIYSTVDACQIAQEMWEAIERLQQAEQYDWLANTDEEVDEQELEAHYSYMEKIQEVPTADSGIDSEPLKHVQNDAGYNVFANELQHSEQSESFSNTCLVETNDSNVIPDSPNMCDDDIQNDQNDAESDFEHQFRALTAQDIEILIQTYLMPLAIKTQNDSFIFVHELKQEMHANLKYVESLEKEIDELESDKAEFSNMYDMVLQEYVSKDVMCSYLLSLSDIDAPDELQCLYLHKKKHSISLEIALQKCKEQVKNDTVWNEKASNVFRKERKQYINIQDLKAKLQDKNIAINELKKLIEKGKGKSVDTRFDKPSVVRQPNSQRIPKPSVLGKLTRFSNSLKRIYFSTTKLVPKTNVLEVTAQTLPQTAKQAVCNTNVLKPGMYRIDNSLTLTRAPQLSQTVRNTNPRVSTSTRVNHKTNISRPHHKSNQLNDKVLPNNSQAKPKKTQVEVHPRIPSVSNKMKSVTVCKDSLNSKTSNANAVCATCNKCLVNSNHIACVMKMLNDVNARTKKPNVMPISTRKPKSHANKAVATPHKKKVASKSTNQKQQSYFRMLHELTSRTWKWWIEKQSLSGYKWVPKAKM